MFFFFLDSTFNASVHILKASIIRCSSVSGCMCGGWDYVEQTQASH